MKKFIFIILCASSALFAKVSYNADRDAAIIVLKQLITEQSTTTSKSAKTYLNKLIQKQKELINVLSSN